MLERKKGQAVTSGRPSHLHTQRGQRRVHAELGHAVAEAAGTQDDAATGEDLSSHNPPHKRVSESATDAHYTKQSRPKHVLASVPRQCSSVPICISQMRVHVIGYPGGSGGPHLDDLDPDALHD